MASHEASLEAAIASVTDRAADIRKKIPSAIRGYCEKRGMPVPDGNDSEAISEAERRLALPKPGKPFDRISFDEFTHVLLGHTNAPKLTQATGQGEVRSLLQKVWDARNKLAHFRGDLTPDERRTIQFASEWLERNLPTPIAELPTKSTNQPRAAETTDAENNTEEYLEGQPKDVDTLTLTFHEIEKILGKELPRSAFDYRVWWSNDTTKPQSAAWLDVGWRTTSISMTEARLSFVRTNDRENAYIGFFAQLNSNLEKVSGFPLRRISPQGQNWMPLASLDRVGLCRSYD